VNTITWLGIILCLSQSAVLSGANLAFFSISKMRLELEVKRGNSKAKKVMELRKNSNFLLVTILWANVSINVLLALLSESVMTGVYAFLFSTVLITIVGEILPQAYFTRKALNVAAFLSPLIRLYQVIFYPVAAVTAWVLDHWLGEEVINYYREKDFEELIAMHINATDTEIQKVEGIGAINFLSMDDRPLSREGEPVDPKSILKIPFENEDPVLPDRNTKEGKEFLQKVDASGHKWVILTDQQDQPRLVLDADHFLRGVMFHSKDNRVLEACHRPIIIRDEKTSIGEVLPRFKAGGSKTEEDVIDEDVVLLWGGERRIITGTDILRRLLRGIVKKQ